MLGVCDNNSSRDGAVDGAATLASWPEARDLDRAALLTALPRDANVEPSRVGISANKEIGFTDDDAYDGLPGDAVDAADHTQLGTISGYQQEIALHTGVDDPTDFKAVAAAVRKRLRKRKAVAERQQCEMDTLQEQKQALDYALSLFNARGWSRSDAAAAKKHLAVAHQHAGIALARARETAQSATDERRAARYRRCRRDRVDTARLAASAEAAEKAAHNACTYASVATWSYWRLCLAAGTSTEHAASMRVEADAFPYGQRVAVDPIAAPDPYPLLTAGLAIVMLCAMLCAAAGVVWGVCRALAAATGCLAYVSWAHSFSTVGVAVGALVLWADEQRAPCERRYS